MSGATEPESSSTTTEQQLFDWPEAVRKRRPRRSKYAAAYDSIERPPGYHLVANSKGVIGWHRTKIPEAAMASHGSVVTYCGRLGRRISEYPSRIPALCDDCETEYAKQ